MQDYQKDTPRKMAMSLFDTVRQTMNVQEMKEFWNIWEIAPKYDTENLRESYVAKEKFLILVIKLKT